MVQKNPALTRLIPSGKGIGEEVIYQNSTWETIKKEFS